MWLVMAEQHIVALFTHARLRVRQSLSFVLLKDPKSVPMVYRR